MSVIEAGRAPDLAPHSFEFRGNGVEYFWICVRTFLLAIITLGIYDAWGTVERRRYFWGNTTVAGHGFDYHARPGQILVGRLIVIGILVVTNAIVTFYPVADLFILAAFILLLPWIFNRVLSFQLGNTSYRNVRFGFNPSYWHAMLYVVVLPLIVLPFTLGLLYPLVAKLLREYVINRMSFGRSGFDVSIPLGPLYKVFAILVFVFMLPLFAVVGYMIYQIAEAIGSMQTGGTMHNHGDIAVVMESLVPLFFGTYALLIAGLIVFGAVFGAVLRNVAVSAMQMQGGHRFISEIPVAAYAWRVVSRGFLATISLGLLLPWANVDLHRFVMSHTTLLAKGDLEGFVGDGADPGGAAAAEYGIMDGVADGAFGV